MGVGRGKKKTGRPVRVPGEKGTKEKIFDAAVGLFADKGYGRVSIRDIARAVGVTEGAIYRHYAGKEALLEAIFAYYEGRIFPRAPGAGAGALADGVPLAEILESMPKTMAADPQLARVTRIMLIEMYHDARVRDYVARELFSRPVDAMEALFKKLMDKGEVRPCDARALATLFISSLFYWYFEAFVFHYGEAPGALDGELHALIGLLVDLAAPSAPGLNRPGNKNTSRHGR